MGWVLDTNVVIACLRGNSPETMKRLHEKPAGDVSIPCQVLAELLLGAEKSQRPGHNKQAALSFIRPFRILWPTIATVEQYVSIRAYLEQRGIVIGEADLWIAAAARELGAVIVTNNVGEFSRVPGLTFEDWTKP